MVEAFIMEIQILELKTKSKLCLLERLSSTTSIKTVKSIISRKLPKYYVERQSLRLDPKAKAVKDEDTLSKLNISNGGILYFKDLGRQISWSTVFYCEYSGPLLAYLFFYLQLINVYGVKTDINYYKPVVHIAAICHTFHYLKRILETTFVHRFSHGTMPIKNLFRNTSYYTLFGAWMGYLINHPLYTPPMYGDIQIYSALACFLFCELGNFSIHIALKNLRPAGSKERKIPKPDKNPFTLLFNFVSCPNYTYEVGIWMAFAVMTQCLTALLFALVGFAQMAVWALGKHRNYKKEFSNYPRRKAILPFVL